MKEKFLKNSVRRLAGSVRQSKTHSEFGISSSAARLDRDPVEKLAEGERATQQQLAALHMERTAARATAAPSAPPEPPAPRSRGDDRGLTRFIGDIATGLWRLRRRMIDPATKRPVEAMRREYRHVEALWDVLAQFGVEVLDFDGQPFDPGRGIKALDQIPKPGLKRARVQETIKPLVKFRGQDLPNWYAEAIIEVPAESDEGAGAAPAAPAPPQPDTPPAPGAES